VARLSRLTKLSEGGGAATVERRAGAGLVLRFARAQLLLVDRVLGALDWDVPLAALRAQLARAPAELEPAPAPRAFTGALTAHQRAGLSWLQWLEGVGMSGCLADDASLGTTVQVLALVLDRRERGRAEAPSLVVAPRSRLPAWLAEARRCAPSLRVSELSRASTGQQARSADLLLTTYAALRETTDALAGLVLDYLVIDAPCATAAARAASTQTVRTLGSRHRLALSGAPVAPHLGAMVPLFEFLNPGIFGPPQRETGARARRRDREEEARLLSLALQPLILRRSRGEILAAPTPTTWGAAPHVGRPGSTAARGHVP
jgi:SNF2 family DNA or RNA helicase